MSKKTKQSTEDKKQLTNIEINIQGKYNFLSSKAN